MLKCTVCCIQRTAFLRVLVYIRRCIFLNVLEQVYNNTTTITIYPGVTVCVLCMNYTFPTRYFKIVVTSLHGKTKLKETIMSTYSMVLPDLRAFRCVLRVCVLLLFVSDKCTDPGYGKVLPPISQHYFYSRKAVIGRIPRDVTTVTLYTIYVPVYTIR